MPARAEIYGLRSHDNRLSIWFDVLPERMQAYAFPGKDCLHVVFGGRNVGDEDGYLWGRMTTVYEERITAIIPKKKRWCAVGEYVWWEKTFDMPTHNLALKVEVGSNTEADEEHIFTVYAGEPPFDYTWRWEGRTNKVTFKWIEDINGNFVSGNLPPLDTEFIETAKSAYYGVVLGEFIRECAEQGITISPVNIVPSAWVERGDVSKVRGVPLFPPKFILKQDVTVHIAGKVYFNSNQDLSGSPIAPALVIAIGKVIAMVIGAIMLGLVALTLVEVFRDMVTIESVVKKRNTITVGEEGWTVTEDIELPDGTVIPAGTYFAPGTVIDWETEEKIEEPAIAGIAALGIILLLALALAPRAVREVREVRRR